LAGHLQGSTDELYRVLERHLSTNLHRLTLTNNRSTILSTRPTPHGLDLRVHWSFVGAPKAVVEALALAAGGKGGAKRRALALLREHFRHHWQSQWQPRPPGSVQPRGEGSPEGAPPAPRPRRPTLRAEGRCFDLQKIRDRLNDQYFENRVEVAIGWGKSPAPPRRQKRRRRQSIHLGTFRPLPAGPEQGTIRIHPVLDREEVPLYVVESVVHHEMLHADLPATVVRGRRRLHTPEFRRREALYVHYHQARAWIDAHLDHLLTQRYRR
jgi:hypothetical protein